MIIMIICTCNLNDLENDYKNHLVITIEINLPVSVENDEYC
jgi:hypothetical protein